MVKVIDITKKQKEKKEKESKMISLVKEFFEEEGNVDPSIWGIRVWKNEDPNNSIVEIPYSTTFSIVLYKENLKNKVLKFAKEYQKFFEKEIIIETDYSNKI